MLHKTFPLNVKYLTQSEIIIRHVDQISGSHHIHHIINRNRQKNYFTICKAMFIYFVAQSEFYNVYISVLLHMYVICFPVVICPSPKPRQQIYHWLCDNTSEQIFFIQVSSNVLHLISLIGQKLLGKIKLKTHDFSLHFHLNLPQKHLRKS